ncbi:MAG: ATP-binding protein [Gammaproteobacteria bacterium]|nr:ATP-binding protein [Gammaproteobacteria bacterium]
MNEQRTSVAARAAHLPQLTTFLQQFWSSASLPPGECLAFELALEEIFMNVVMHGSSEGEPRQVEVSLALTAAGLTLTVEDDGPGFDPLSLPSPNLSASVAERPVGGLGVFLVRRMMDTVSYARVAGRNQLRMSKRVHGQGAAQGEFA